MKLTISRKKFVKPAIFIHIQKTAGTSVQNIARHHYGNDQVCSHGDYLKLDLEACKKFQFISGHFGIKFAEPLLSDRYLFTFLRDPTDRIISLYKFLSRQPADQSVLAAAASSEDLKGFLMRANELEFAKRLWNNQAWQLHSGWVSAAVLPDLKRDVETDPRDIDPVAMIEGARQNLRRFDRIGFVESFDRDIRKIFKDLGAPHIKVPKSNSSESSFEIADKETLSLIDEITELDRLVFEDAKKLFLAK